MSTLAEVEALVNAKAKEIFAKENATFTRSKGGTAEREEIISQIQVPDLWKIAELFQDKANAIYLPTAARKAAADAILECWHLAHDLRKHFQSNS